MPDDFTSAPAGAPPAASGGGGVSTGTSPSSAPTTSSGGDTGAAQQPAFTSPSPGLAPLAPPSFEAAPQQEAPVPQFDQSGETVAAPPDELPGDDIFNRLSGEERASHWKQARERIAELNGRVAQASQAQQIFTDWGGPEQVQQSLDLLGGLMQPVTDPEGNIVYGDDGLPETTSSAFWTNLRDRSPQLFVQAGEDWLSAEHSPGVRNWQVMFQHVFGLDPGKLELYQRITQSPAEAAQYLPASDIPQYELEDIPAALQDAYKATDPDMRQELQALTPQARDKYLQEKSAFLQERQAREARDQEARQAYQSQQQEADRRLSVEAGNHALEFRRSQRQALKDELARSFSPTSNPEINDRYRERCLDLTEHYVNNDPQVAPLIANADYYMRMAYVLQQKGDQVRAAQAQYEGNSAASRALAMVRRHLSDQVAFENARTSGFREGWDREREQARGRTVLPRSEANGLGSGSFAPRQGSAPFSNERYAEIARQLTMDRQFRSEGL